MGTPRTTTLIKPKNLEVKKIYFVVESDDDDTATIFNDLDELNDYLRDCFVEGSGLIGWKVYSHDRRSVHTPIVDLQIRMDHND